MTCMGTRDYRPTLNVLPPLPPRVRGGDRTPSRANALYLENVHSASFKNVTFEFAAPRLPWFGACLVVDQYSDDIRGASEIKCINGPAGPSGNYGVHNAGSNNDNDGDASDSIAL